ncbi:multiple monosaccharide ABC transporter permease [Spirochaeta africana]|uniref:Xylose transport system permease protein XylH n=1 Tax=Spirochaeta africana (strain ATCC 700263 / DSM 8902 / Z-7692) TaxID=889378 RepID=H9UFU1_SPIAZ|nr:multiple monosaccharide ABC transporter permease [Spirochaeta africana]AFG36384.1 ABC-type xylose transport system, permease component [Spirochaeta africana DSM 8902]
MTRIKAGQSSMQILKDQAQHNVRQYSMFIALIGIGIIFTFLTNGIFMSPRNLSNLLLQTSFIGILAVGMTLVIVGGHIDLSVGSIVGFTGAFAAVLQVELGVNTITVVILTLILGAIIGVWQGFWVAYRGVPAFIVTLAGMLIFRGALIALTGGQTIAPLQPAFRAIGQGYLPRLFINTDVIAGFHDFTFFIAIASIIGYVVMELRTRARRNFYGFVNLPMPLFISKLVLVSLMVWLFFSIPMNYRGVPYSIMILLGLVLIFSYIANNTTFGRHVYAIGGNKEAALLSGINIKLRTMWIFIIMGTLSGLSGLVFTARLNSATASAGNLFELDTIAAVFIGGTSMRGGEGTVFGAIIGALVMASLNNGMSLMNISSEYQLIVKGLILILAVWFDISSRGNNS